ncbi:MAG: division/cell wall cluster transcriptional repressor MraZ [Desulfuromonadaceae bacterium]|nr:division/cell wall cluster transcriptional repressor MraZ [Desulfuromonadaceae bacterium]
MSFSGTFFNNIDPKGRLSIPAKLRGVLTDDYGDELLIVTRGKAALVAYPFSDWQKIKARVDAMPNGDARDLIYRTRISPAIECGFDGQGRIAIPPSLRTLAMFEKEVVVIGLGNKIEMWSQARFEEQMRRDEEQLSTLKAELGDLGF